MHFNDTAEQAREFAAKALQLMLERDVAPTPANFAVWYVYVAGHEPELTRTLDILIDNAQDFSDARNVDLYKKYMSSDLEGQALSDTTGRVEVELGKILSILTVADGGAQAYGKSLAEASNGLADASIGLADAGDATKVEGVIAHMLSETRKMEQINQALEQKLQKSSDEIVHLKEDLDAMREEAMTDALTGIANRKMFDFELRRVAADAMESGTSLCLLMLDIDHFKRFNDTYGHQVGDQVLKLLGATLTSAVKGQDTAARYGGEEFAVILPSTDLDGATNVAEDIRGRINGKVLKNKTSGEDLGAISVSIGVGCFEFGEPLADFIRRADESLYLAKRTGRNKVVTQNEVKEEALSFDS